MGIPVITKPVAGQTTKASLAGLFVDAVTSLNAQGNAVYNSQNGCPNLINGSFELDSDGNNVPDNWAFTPIGGGSGTIDNSVFKHGAFSYKFTCPGGGAPVGGGYLQSTDFLPVSTNYTYCLRFLTQSSNAGAQNYVDIFWFKNDQTACSHASDTIWSDTSTNPASWSQRQGFVKPPSDAAFCQVRMTGCTAGSPACTVNYDGVEFYYNDIRILSTDTDATVGDFSLSLIIFSGLPGNKNLNLPQIGANLGYMRVINLDATHNVTVTPFAGDSINTGGAITLTPGQSTTLVADAATAWLKF